MNYIELNTLIDLRPVFNKTANEYDTIRSVVLGGLSFFSVRLINILFNVETHINNNYFYYYKNKYVTE